MDKKLEEYMPLLLEELKIKKTNLKTANNL